MKRPLLICFLNVLSLPLFAQTELDKLRAWADSVKTVSGLETMTFPVKKMSISKQEEFTLVNGIVQTRWALITKKGSDWGYLTLSYNDNIFYREQFEYFDVFYDGTKLPSAKYYFVDSIAYKTIDAIYLEKYQNHINLGFIARTPKRDRFSVLCKRQDVEQQMLRLVESKDVSSLEKWLMSTHPLMQAYAYVGLCFLQARKQTTLGPGTRLMMNEIKASPFMMKENCSDAISSVPLSTLLTDENILIYLKKYDRMKSEE